MARLSDVVAIALLRPDPHGGLQIYLVRRRASSRYLAGFDGLPGAIIDAEQTEGGDQTTTSDAGLSAALRSVFVATGVLAVDGAEELDVQARRQLHREVTQNPSSWHDHLTQLGLTPSTERLLPLGNWVTRLNSTTRANVRCFGLYLLVDQGPDLSPGTHAAGRWVATAEGLADFESGKIMLTGLTLDLLRALDSFGPDLSVVANALASSKEGVRSHTGEEYLRGVRIVAQRAQTLPPILHTNCFVLGRDELVVVDPASPFRDEQDRLLQYLDRLVGCGARISQVWLSHGHEDHVGAVACVCKRFRVPVLAHRLTRERLAGKIRIDEEIEDEQELTFDSGSGKPMTWIAYHTPGHAVGHLSFFERSRRVLLTGDLVGPFKVATVAGPGSNMTDYWRSSRRLLELGSERLFPSHGRPICVPKAKLESQLAELARREEQIVAALSSPASIVRLSARLHGFPSPGQLRFWTIRAHLDKLVAEGRVLREGGIYRAIRA